MKFVCHFCKETTIESDQISKLINGYQSTFKVTIVKRILTLFKLRVSWNYVYGPLYDCLYACLIVWLFFLYPINVKKVEPIGPYFVGDLTLPEGRFTDHQNWRKKFLKNVDFFENALIRKKSAQTLKWIKIWLTFRVIVKSLNYLQEKGPRALKA